MDPERILPVQVPVKVTLPRATTTASLYRSSWHGFNVVMVATYFIILSDGVVGVPVGVCPWSGAVARLVLAIDVIVNICSETINRNQLSDRLLVVQSSKLSPLTVISLIS